MNFFRNFIARVQCKRNSGLKFFSPFLGLSHPVLARNIAWNRFFNFLNFFAFFFRKFLAGGEYERNWGLKFFSPLPGLSHPVLARNIAWNRFFFFFFLWIFSLFFSEFPCRGRVWTELGPKIFFTLSCPISSCFSKK